MAVAKVNPKADDKPKKVLNRVMIDSSKDSFYGTSYDVITRESLNYFDPTNNSNKFYIAEVHQSSTGLGFRFYINHGRVGAKGVEKAEKFDSLASASSKFKTKVNEKMHKGYVRVDLATVARGSAEGQKQINDSALKGVVDTSKIKLKSSLHPKVTDLIVKLFDEANQAVSLSMTGSIKTDISAPLGNLGLTGIQQGRQVLSNISRALTLRDIYTIRNLSVNYYRFIPRKLHGDLRDESNWILNTRDRIQKELDILDLYEDTLRMMPVMGVSDLDKKYLALNCDIAFVDDSETLTYVEHKIKTTHAANHNFKLKVKNVYAVNMKNAPQFDSRCGNVRNLFHGSRSANMVGILSSYLKLPTQIPNVHKTGAMFGSGIYFASDCTKSANYSLASFGGRGNKYDTAYLMICEVALGNVHKVDVAKSFSTPPNGYHSVMGCKGPHLINNEFIIYNPTQARVKYLVEVEKVR